MTALTFTEDRGRYVCETKGFKGIMQIDREKASRIEVYAHLDDFTHEKLIFEEFSTSTHRYVDISEVDNLKIVCFAPVIKAGYEPDTE